MRDACQLIKEGITGFDLSGTLPARANSAIDDWRQDSGSAYKLYRASYLLATARQVDYRYEFVFDDSKVVRDLVRSWMKMPSQKSYEFSRYGFIFVSAYSPYEFDGSDFLNTLLMRDAKDEGLWACYVHLSYSTSQDKAKSLKAIHFAETLRQKYPKQVNQVSLCLLAYLDAWMDDKKHVDYLDKAIELTRVRQSMLPAGHPWKGKEDESIREYEKWKLQYGG